MQKEYLTPFQLSCIIIMVIMAATLVFGVGYDLGQDAWIPLIFSLVIIIPVILMYGRIMHLLPEKDIFEMLEELFGKILGKILIAIFIWHAFYLGSGVLRTFSDYIQTVAMPETPAMPLSMIMILTVIYLAKSGMKAFGKWAIISLIVICVMLIFTILSSLKSMDFTNILPIMGHDFKTIFKTTITQFFLPFGETVYFLGLAGSLRKKDNPYKTYFVGIFIAFFLTLLIIVCNIELLGPAMVSAVTYPSYSAAKIINIGDFFAKIESIISTNYILAGIAKTNFCIIVTTKGIAKIVGIKDYKLLLAPVSLLIMVFSLINYENAAQVFSFIKIYPIYMIPFTFVIPGIVWIAAEIKTHKNKSKQRLF